MDAKPTSGTPFRAVLFDFDGTLVDSYPAITASVNHVRSLRGLPPLGEAEVRRHVGRGPDYLLEHTVAAGNLGDNLAAYREHHPSVLRPGTRFLPGAAETLRALRARHFLLAVCSNKPVAFTRELVAYLGDRAGLTNPYLDAVLGPEDVARPKPAPEMLRTALGRLGVSAKEALYVGDMVVDVEAARAAGLAVWVVPTGSEEVAALERSRPDRLLPDLGSLPALLGPGGE